MPIVETRKDQVYVLTYTSLDGKGILGIFSSRDKAVAEWRRYHANPRLINDFLSDSILEYWMDDDPDDAIEVCDVQD